MATPLPNGYFMQAGMPLEEAVGARSYVLEVGSDLTASRGSPWHALLAELAELKAEKVAMMDQLHHHKMVSLGQQGDSQVARTRV